MTRLSVNLNDETAVAIRDSMRRHGRTATETIRRAVSMYRFLIRARDAGQRVRLVDKDGAVTYVEFL